MLVDKLFYTQMDSYVRKKNHLVYNERKFVSDIFEMNCFFGMIDSMTTLDAEFVNFVKILWTKFIL